MHEADGPNLQWSYGITLNIVHCYLDLDKKSEKWMPTLLSKENKVQRLRFCQELKIMIQMKSIKVIGNIVIMGSLQF